MDFRGRLQRLQASLEADRLDVVVLTYLPNVRYICGFAGSAGVLIVTGRKAVFFTDGRYAEQAHEEVKGASVTILKGKSPLAAVGEWLGRERKLRRIGIEAAHLTVAERDALAKALRIGTKLVKAPATVERMRMVKEAAEIELIRKACHLGARLFDVVRRAVSAGISESQVAGELEFAARKAGAEQMSFPTIIAGGRRSALPHGRASQAKLPTRGFVVCDFGVILAGYCSDMTRALHVGRPTAEARRVYEAVHDAQRAALEAVAPGVTAGEVDHAARKLLKERGLGRYFSHSTGHGLGLEIHEAPRVAAGQNEVLRPGTVITIEPGAYLPGKFGVRIEDTIVVTETVCEILTPCPKELIVI